MVLHLDHAQLMIPRGGEPAARRFYCDVLGLCEIEKPAALRVRGGLWLTVGAQQLHLGVDDAPVARSRAHVAFAVDDLDAHRRTLVAAGVDVIDGTQTPAFRRLEIRDPFGNRIELLEYVK